MYRDRDHAAYLLAKRLARFKGSDSVVVAIPRGGVRIGFHIAQALHLPLDVIPSQRIKNPSNETIGSVSLNGLDMISECDNIPQDFIYHQVSAIKHRLADRYRFYHGGDYVIDLEGKTVLLVDDRLESENQVIACIRSIQSHHPKKVVVITPIISSEILKKLKDASCDVIYLNSTSHTNSSEIFYEYLPPVTDDEVKQFLTDSKATQPLNSPLKRL